MPLKNAFTLSLSFGILLQPPTMITSSISSLVNPEAAMAFSMGGIHLSNIGSQIYSNSPLVRSYSKSSLLIIFSKKIVALKVLESICLASLQLYRNFEIAVLFLLRSRPCSSLILFSMESTIALTMS